MRSISPRLHNDTVSITPAGHSVSHAPRPRRCSHTVNPSNVSAASNWFDVPNSPQNTRHNGTLCPFTSAGGSNASASGPASVIAVAATPRHFPSQPNSSINTYRASRVHASSVSKINVAKHNNAKPCAAFTDNNPNVA